MIEIDGGQMSGSGTIVRQTVAYSALLRAPVRVINRNQPGTRPDSKEVPVRHAYETTEHVGEVVRSEVNVKAGQVVLAATLSRPRRAEGLVLFAHGSGSSRFSPRNRLVAARLNESGFATLLLDLLTQQEEVIDERTAELRFDIPFLGRRMTDAVDWATGTKPLRDLKIGLFGASTGTAAALLAAAERPDAVAAVVSRGGRPDLAADALPRVAAPCLLIVGGRDYPVIDMNREAQRSLGGPSDLQIVPGATHLFEEPGALERVAELAAQWFKRHLVQRKEP